MMVAAVPLLLAVHYPKEDSKDRLDYIMHIIICMHVCVCIALAIHIQLCSYRVLVQN